MPGAYLWGWDDTNSVWVKCVVNADGKLIINPTGFLENPPTENLSTKAPTSEWAFDHDADPSAHHAKYTDAESRAAIGDLFNSVGQANKTLNMKYFGVQYANPFVFRVAPDDDQQISLGKVKDYNRIVLTCNHFGVGLEDMTFEIYDGAAYQKVIREDTFQAELDDYLENPPTEDVANKAPTSEWAFDHDADSSAHHTKYTDGDAVGAFAARSLTILTGTETSRNISAYNLIYLDSGGGVITLEGFAGGTDGQIVFFVNIDGGNNIVVDHWSVNAAAGNKIMCYSSANETLTAGNLGGFTMIYKGSYWFILNPLT